MDGEQKQLLRDWELKKRQETERNVVRVREESETRLRDEVEGGRGEGGWGDDDAAVSRAVDESCRGDDLSTSLFP